MKYEDARRLRDVASPWLRLKLWWHQVRRDRRPPANALNELSDHIRRDIGLQEPVRYMDWRALKDRCGL